MSLLVTGWVAHDDIETPFGKVERSLGGSATCAALAGALFTDVRLLAAVGEDFPDEHRALLDRPGIDLAGLCTVPGKTSRWGAATPFAAGCCVRCGGPARNSARCAAAACAR